MHPVLKPALLRVWRDSSTIQLGLDPRHGLVLDGVSDAAAAVLDLLDGTREWPDVVAAAGAQGCDPADAAALLDLLQSHGALEDAAARSCISVTELERLEPDRAHASLVAAGSDGGTALLRRRDARIVVVGAGRVGASAASLLCAAGVGAVVVCDARAGRAADASPAGFRSPGPGSTRAVAAAAAAREAGAGRVTATRLAVDEPRLYAGADVVLLAPDIYTGPSPGLLATLLSARVPYLLAALRETCGVVGPLVLPGVTACPRCLDLFRAERDPAWPAVAAQLAASRPGAVPPCDVVLATLVASIAAGQLLDHVDGRAVSALGATLEVPLPDWQLLRRTWRRHPACGCTAAAS